jgi:conjugative relaxase-like TrwC/TraI family protein
MLTCENISTKAAIEYFIKDRIAGLEDYYFRGTSRWFGRGAASLNLVSEPIKDPKAFENLMNGISPSGDCLQAKKIGNKQRRSALDCTFSAPKSVSLTALVAGDERLIEAHQKAVEKTLLLIEERYALTRVSINKKREVRNFKNLLIAEFDHVENRDLDPHLHTHALIFNLVQVEKDKWYSLSNEEIYRNRKMIGMIYQHNLAAEVQKLGYPIHWNCHGQFEISGYKKEDLIEFSNRRRKILEAAGQAPTWVERERAWKVTRESRKKIDFHEMRARWQEEARQLGLKFIKPEEQPIVNNPEKSILELCEDAISHCSETKNSFTQEELEKFVLSHAYYPLEITEIEKNLDPKKQLIELDSKFGNHYTTENAVLQEIQLITNMYAMQGTDAPIADINQARLLLQETSLNKEQESAILATIASKDKIFAWQGNAGAGKTFALKHLTRIAEKSGYIVKAYAPTAKASLVLERELEIKSTTVASLLATAERDAGKEKQLWIIDEAGMLGTTSMLELLENARKQGARILLVGDTKQLSAIQAGAPFRLLQRSGLETRYLTKNLRQKNRDLKTVVDWIAQGFILKAFDRLIELNYLEEVTPEEKIKKIVLEFLGKTKEERNETLILAGTNEERRKITEALRESLKKEGSLQGSKNLRVLRTKSLSEIEKDKYLENVKVGDFIIPERNYRKRNLEKGKIYKVINNDKKFLTLEDEKGNLIRTKYNFKKSIFQEEVLEIAVGDKVQWKKNILQNINGLELEVEKIDDEKIWLRNKNDKVITKLDIKKPHFIDHSFVRTVYSSQGETAKNVIVAADFTFGKENFYVAVSRAKKSLKIFTENAKVLRKIVQEERGQENAIKINSEYEKTEVIKKQETITVRGRKI